MQVACTRCNMFFISLMYMHVCVYKIDDVGALVESTSVFISRVHENLHKHGCLSVTCTPNLVRIHVDVYTNCKPRMTV